MALVTRQGKGSKLTISEMDGNMTYLENLANFSQQFQTKTPAIAGDIATISPDGKVGSINSSGIATINGVVIDILTLRDGDILSLVYREGDRMQIQGNTFNLIRTNKDSGQIFDEVIAENVEFGDETILAGLKLFQDPVSELIFFVPKAGILLLMNLVGTEVDIYQSSLPFGPNNTRLRMDSIVAKEGKIYFTSLYSPDRMQIPTTYVFVGEITEDGEGNPTFQIIDGQQFEVEGYQGLLKLTHHQNTNRVLATPIIGESLFGDYASISNVKSVTLSNNTLTITNTGLDLGTKLKFEFCNKPKSFISVKSPASASV